MFVCAALLVHIHLALVHVYGTARAHHGGTMEEVNPCPIFWGRGVKNTKNYTVSKRLGHAKAWGYGYACIFRAYVWV